MNQFKFYLFASGNYSLKTKNQINQIDLDNNSKIVLFNQPKDDSIKKLLNKYDKNVDFRFGRLWHPHIYNFKLHYFDDFNHSNCLFYFDAYRTKKSVLNNVIDNHNLFPNNIFFVDKYLSDRLLIIDDNIKIQNPSLGCFSVYFFNKFYNNPIIYCVNFTDLLNKNKYKNTHNYNNEFNYVNSLDNVLFI